MTSRIPLSLRLAPLVSRAVLIVLYWVRHELLTFLLVTAFLEDSFLHTFFDITAGYDCLLRTSVKSGILVVRGASSPAIDVNNVALFTRRHTWFD